MALTNTQIEAHLGRLLRTLVAGLTTENQVDKLGRTMQLLMPAMQRYVTGGSLGTQADRLEAMTSFRDAAFQKITGRDPAASQHFLSNHWNIDED